MPLAEVSLAMWLRKSLAHHVSVCLVFMERRAHDLTSERRRQGEAIGLTSRNPRLKAGAAIRVAVTG